MGRIEQSALASLGAALLAPALIGLPAAACLAQGQTTAAALVEALSLDDYKRAIETLAAFGDRRTGSDSYERAARWVEARLSEAGYAVEHYEFRTASARTVGPLRDTYVTKIGSTSPDAMLIVSAHLDGIGGGGAADDDASGAALVLAAALAFAPDSVETDYSIRFVFWNGEEQGRDGSEAYARDRGKFQGIEVPSGSGRYPEPRWLGIIQHDMLLFDHGLPPGPAQSAEADIDIEFQQGSDFARESRALAEIVLEANRAHSSDYPAEIGADMRYTDSVAFQDLAPAISVRENQRVAEIGQQANPNWHQATDVYATYSEDDFKLGFNALQMTVGATAWIVGLH